MLVYGASLFGNMLAGKGVILAGEEKQIRAPTHPLIIINIQKYKI